MDNELITQTPEDTEETTTVSLEKPEDDATVLLNPEDAQPVDAHPADTQPAFDYKPPVVEAPEPPTVSDMPTQPGFTSQPAYQQPQYQQPQYQQPQYQQPQYQQPQYQQPQYQQPQYQQPQYQQPQYQQAQYQQPQNTPESINQQPYYQYAPVNPALVAQQNTSDGYAIASLICAIVGLCSCCTVIPSLLGVIFATISKVKNDGSRPTGVSTAGLVIGIIGLILNVIMVLGMIFSSSY